MRIDAHQHFWRFEAQRDTWISDEMSVLRHDFLPEDLLPEMRANQIEASIAVQADPSEQETEFLLGLAEKHSFMAAVVGWTDLCAPDVAARLLHFSQFQRLCGFRHIVQSEPDDGFMLRPEFRRGIAALAAHHFTYDILIYAKQLPAAMALVEKFPDQAFMLDHLAKPEIRSARLEPWASQIRALAENRNVLCKLSGLVTEADWRNWRASDFRPYLDVAVAAFGVDRLVFGSDWPVCLLGGTYGRVKELIDLYLRGFSEVEKSKIFGQNAAKFYGLGGSS